MSLLERVRKKPTQNILKDMKKEEKFFLVRYLDFGVHFRLSCFERLAKGIENTQNQLEKERLWFGALMQWGASLEDLGAWCLALQKATAQVEYKPVLYTLLTYRVDETLLDDLLGQASSFEDFVSKIGLDEKSFQSIINLDIWNKSFTYKAIIDWFRIFFEDLPKAHGRRSLIKQSYNQLKHGAVVGRWKNKENGQENPTIYQLANEQKIARQIVEYKFNYINNLWVDIRNISQIISAMIVGYILKKYPNVIVKTEKRITCLEFKVAQPK